MAEPRFTRIPFVYSRRLPHALKSRRPIRDASGEIYINLEDQRRDEENSQSSERLPGHRNEAKRRQEEC